MFDLLIMRIAHFFRKHIRGDDEPEFVTLQHDVPMRRWSSGYTEALRKDGKWIDVYSDIHFVKHDWGLFVCHEDRNGSTALLPKRMRRDAAIKFVETFYGAVTAVDDTAKVITCRERN
jgi:hypothetical protein